MIELLHGLANKAGMKKVVITIESSRDTHTAVSVQSIPGDLKKGAPEEHVKIRDALMHPIGVSGLPSEIEATLEVALLRYLAVTDTSLDELASQLATIESKLADSKSANSKEKKSPKEASDNSDSLGDTKEKIASGEQDSL